VSGPGVRDGGSAGGAADARLDDWPRSALHGEPEILVLDSPDDCAAVAAERIAGILAAAVNERGRAHWATTGGSTPAGIYRHLSQPPLRDTVPWEQVHIWLGDERFVPRSDDWCNARIGDRDLVAAGAGTELGRTTIHAWPVDRALAEGRDAAWCAVAYIEAMREAGVAFAGGQPVMDVVLVGIGPDGHLLSVFPGSEAFETEVPAMAIPAPTHIAPKVERITLNPRVLAVGRTVMAVAHGRSKAEILAEIFGPDHDPRRLPAQLARHDGAVWLLDRASAARLGTATGSGG
jgi:6-phosphogluconolactonase